MSEHVSIIDEIENALIVYRMTGNAGSHMAKLLERAKAHIEGEKQKVIDRMMEYQHSIGKYSKWPAHPDCEKCKRNRERMRGVSAHHRQIKRDAKGRKLKVVGG